jgi:3-oxoacyl-[acyl-carrier protein] reductase
LSLGEFVASNLGRCDILVNNAAIYRGMQAVSQLEVDIEYWRRTFAVNVDGALLCTQALAPMMIEAGWGRIVNQSSVAAYQGHGGHYGVTKLALVALTQGFARELGPHGITVNAIAPAIVFTDATLETLTKERIERRLREMPISRRAQPADLVGLLLFLVSESASWITGQTHVIDGGLISRL